MKNPKSLLVILFIVAIIPSSVFLFFYNQPPPYGSDAFDFHQMAIGLLHGKGFNSNTPVGDIRTLPNARHPLYPIFIAIIYFFTNYNVTAVKIIQILLHGLICILIFFISEKLFKNRRAAFCTALLWALYPLAISHSILLLCETLLTFLLLVSVYFILNTWENPSLVNGFFSGLFLGLTALTKAVVLAFIPALFLCLALFSKHKLCSKLKNFSIIIFFMILTISPWIIRNYLVFKQFVPFSTSNGLSFYRYNNEETLLVINTPVREAFPFTQEQKKKIATLSEPEIDKYLYRLGWQFIKSHPKDFFRIRFGELFFFWHLWPTGPERFSEYYSQVSQPIPMLERLKSTYLLYFAKILYHLPYDILFLGMFVSLIASFKKDKEEWAKSLLLFLLIMSINAVYIFHHGSDRYRLPIDPYVFILGLHGARVFYEKIRNKNLTT